MVSATQTAFQIAQSQLDEAARLLELDAATHSLLREPLREITVKIPVRMDDGSVRVFTGFRVQYNDARGPFKGGLRWHPDESLDTVRALAAWMTWKTALVGIPLGGGKGGVICNPKELSAGEKERLARGYIRKVAPILGAEVDVPAPDVYTDGQIMTWMLDEFETLRGHHEAGVITGKPLAIGGVAGRDDATARGGMFTLREWAKVKNVDLSACTAAVQGYGNAGQNAHRLLGELFGTKVVAVSDSRGAIYHESGLDFKALEEHKARTGSVIGFPGSQPLEASAILELKVDVLVPAALEGVITEKNAGKIQSRVVAELANGPTTPEADRILYERGVFVIPDFLCNAGGVTVSWMEQVQNAGLDVWPRSKTIERLDEIMTTAFHEVYETHQHHGVNPRMGAYMVAVRRVADACKLRGWV